MIVNPDEGADSRWPYHVRTRKISRWQSGYGEDVEEWCMEHIGSRGVDWEISFGLFMFRTREQAMLFSLTWQDL